MIDSVRTEVLPRLLTTAIGSLPHLDAESAVQLILKSLSVAPHLPQLSRLDPREQMWIQFSEGLPGFKADFEELKYFFETSGDHSAHVETFFEEYLAIIEGASSSRFKITPDYGLGIEICFDKLNRNQSEYPIIKAQVTGPLSFALSVTDENGKPIFYHQLFKDVAVKGMGLKSIWLIEKFRPFAENVIVFFDEPSLSAYGSSAFLGVSSSDVIESLNDVFSMASSRGALTGIHCCGNTDWSLLMSTDVDIINFDAVDYLESLAIYSEQLSDFLGRGGVLAWGVVPNDARINEETVEDSLLRLKKGVSVLEEKGVDRKLLLRRIIVTPACGCAGLTVKEVEKVYEILSSIDKMELDQVFG